MAKGVERRQQGMSDGDCKTSSGSIPFWTRSKKHWAERERSRSELELYHLDGQQQSHYQVKHMMELAGEALDNFIKAQKHFMDAIADETAKATGGKRVNGVHKVKKTQLSALAREATQSFIEAQRKLVDLAAE